MTLTMIMAIIAAMLFGVFCALCLYSVFRNQKDVEKNDNRMRNIEKKLGNMTELINSKTDMLESKINEQPIYNVYSDMIDVNPSYPYDVPAEGTEGLINISDLMGDEFEDVLVDDGSGTASNRSVEEDEVLSAFMSSFKSFEKEFVGDRTENIAEIESKPVETEPAAAEPIEVRPAAAESIEVRPAAAEPVEVRPAVEPVEAVPAAEPVRQSIPAEMRFPESSVNSEEESVAVLAASLSEALKAASDESVDKRRMEQEASPFKHHEGHDVGKSGKKYTASELEMLIRE